MDKWFVYKKCDDFRVATPKSVLDLVEIKSIAENGIFEVGRGGIFTKTYTFTDINFSNASVDEQIVILENWCRWLNSHSAPFKITFNNKNKNMRTLQEEVMFAKKLDDFDSYRDMINEEIEDRIVSGRMGIEQQFYITIRYEASSVYEDAKIYFATLENSMVQAFRGIGSELTPLNATERLRILHDFYRFGNEEYFDFDFSKAVAAGFDFKDAIVGSKLDFSKEDMFISNDKYVSCIYLKQYPTTLSDRFITHLTKLNIKMMGSIDIVPVNDSDVDDLLEGIYLGVERRIGKQTQKRVKNMDFNSDISLVVKMEKDEIEKMIREKKDEDQHFFYTMFNIMVIADSEEQLRKDVELLFITAKSDDSVILDYSYMKQLEALNTILPVGVRQVQNGRNLQTKSLASLFPFNVQELIIPGGNWYGTNPVSKNLCMGNRKRLLNPHGWIFGVTGSGKTTAGKLEIMQTFLQTADDVIVLDPKNDYEDLCYKLHGTYMDVSPTSSVRYNSLEYQGTAVRNIADEKAELILAIVETCKREPLTAKERTLVNRALKYAYTESELKGEVATLNSIYDAFAKIEEPEAKDLQLYLELFTKGSLNIFAEKSNAEFTTSRLMMFGLKNLGTELRDLSMLVILECIKERIYYNASIGKTTWLYVDEFHEVLKTEYTQNYMKSLWMLIRSLGGIITGLTQNVTDVLKNYTTRAMLENSEYMILLKQKPAALIQLTDDLGLSEEMVNKYVIKESGAGKGIIMHGSVVVPVDMTIRHDTELYNLINTNFHELHGSIYGK